MGGKTAVCKGVDIGMTEQVHHPEHYQSDKYECIEVMRAVFGDERVRAFCLCNAFKYLWRATKKGHFEEDVRKANWYTRYIVEVLNADTH